MIIQQGYGRLVRTSFFCYRGWGVQLTQSPLKADKSLLLVVGAEDLPSISHSGDPWSAWTYRWPNTTPYIESSADVSFMTLRISSFCLTHQYGFGLLYTWLAGALCFSLSSWLYHMFQGGVAIRWDAFVFVTILVGCTPHYICKLMVSKVGGIRESDPMAASFSYKKTQVADWV